MRWRFSKMHGAGNDFAILDCRSAPALPDAETLQRMGDRHFGIGFDQLLTVERPRSPGALAAYRILNQDGSFARQCGNGARCIAHWLVTEGLVDTDGFALDSPAGRIQVTRVGGLYTLDMGLPVFAPDQVPLLSKTESLEYAYRHAGRNLVFSALSMGNPHAVMVVEDVAVAPVEDWGEALQSAPLFPEGVNVGFAQRLDDGNIRLRVFERGVGETLACGSGACAAVVSMIRRGLLRRSVAVHLPGGTLMIDWPHDAATVMMTGPAVRVYEGEWLDD